MTANLVKSDHKAHQTSSRNKRQRLNEEVNSLDRTSKSSRGLREDASKDASGYWIKTPSLGPTGESNESNSQALEHFEMTAEDSNILKNLDIEAAVNNLRKFRKMVKVIKRNNENTDGNDSDIPQNNNISNNHHRSDKSDSFVRRDGKDNYPARNKGSNTNSRELNNIRNERSQSSARSNSNNIFKNFFESSKTGESLAKIF